MHVVLDCHMSDILKCEADHATSTIAGKTVALIALQCRTIKLITGPHVVEFLPSL